MFFLTSSALTFAKHRCMPEIEAVAYSLPNTENNIAFKDACLDYEREKANKIIENALKTYLKSSDINFGLEDFCNKFGIKNNFYGKNLPDIVLYIDSHKSEIYEKLDQMGIH